MFFGNGALSIISVVARFLAIIVVAKNMMVNILI